MTINHKGASIFYTDQGAGAPVILLHGFLENHTMWDAFVPYLSLQYRVICIDLLGHGASDCTGYVHTMDEMAAAVKDVVDLLELKKITIIGHSMGGYVGLAFAKAYSENTIGLCLLNSTPEPDDEERKKLRSRANVMAKKQYEQLVRMSFVNLFDPTSRLNYEIEIENALKQALQTPIQGYIAANSGMQLRPASKEFWKSTEIKTGMILGKSDWIIDAQNHKELYMKSTDFFKIIEGGHMPHISQTKKTVSILLQYLKR